MKTDSKLFASHTKTGGSYMQYEKIKAYENLRLALLICGSIQKTATQIGISRATISRLANRGHDYKTTMATAIKLDKFVELAAKPKEESING